MPDAATQVDLVERNWHWTPPRARGALLLAQGVHEDLTIATLIGVDVNTLRRWKTRPEFMERVDNHMQADAQFVLASGIASIIEQVQELDDDWQRLKQIRDERAARGVEARESDPELKDVPGITTGLVVRKEKMIGTGANARQITEWELDRDYLESTMALMKQAAQITGQWTTKQEITGKDGGPLLSVENFRRELMRAPDDAMVIDAEVREVPSDA
jgi:hypothetical protein